MPLGLRGPRAGLAAALLEAADPGGADAVLGGDLAGRQAGVAVGQTGSEIVRDGEFVRVPLVLMDAAAINAYESGYHIGVTGVDTDLTFWGAIRLW